VSASSSQGTTSSKWILAVAVGIGLAAVPIPTVRAQVKLPAASAQKAPGTAGAQASQAANLQAPPANKLPQVVYGRPERQGGVIGVVGKGQLRPERVQYNTRPPKAFVPFTLAELSRIARRTISADDMLPLPSVAQQAPVGPPGSLGRRQVLIKPPDKIRAQELVDRLNEYERRLNTAGYSLRDPGNVAFARLPSNKGLLDLQRQQIKQVHKTVAPATRSALQAQRLGAAKVAPPYQWRGQLGTRAAAELPMSLPALARAPDGSVISPPPPAAVKAFLPFNGGAQLVSQQFGHPETFLAIEDVTPTLDCLQDFMKFRAYKASRASIFGAEFTYFSADVKVAVPTNNPGADSSMSATVQVLGMNLEPSIPFTATGKVVGAPEAVLWSFDVYQAVEQTFQVGPVPLTVRVGFKGSASAGATVRGDSADRSIYAVVSPYVKTSGFIELGVGYGPIEVGMGGELIFVENGVMVLGEVAYRGDEAGSPYFSIFFRAFDHGAILGGRIYLYVSVQTYLAGAVEYSYDIWSDDGVTFGGDLFPPQNLRHYPGTDRALVVEVNRVLSSEDPARVLPHPPGVSVTRSGYVLKVTVWEKDLVSESEYYARRSPTNGDVAGTFVQMMDSQAAAPLLAGFGTSANDAQTNLAVIRPVDAGQSPLLIRVALREDDTYAYPPPFNFQFSTSRFLDVAPGAPTEFWILYDVACRTFQTYDVPTVPSTASPMQLAGGGTGTPRAGVEVGSKLSTQHVRAPLGTGQQMTAAACGGNVKRTLGPIPTTSAGQAVNPTGDNPVRLWLTVYDRRL
jgi:hypothetical protein